MAERRAADTESKDLGAMGTQQLLETLGQAFIKIYLQGIDEGVPDDGNPVWAVLLPYGGIAGVARVPPAIIDLESGG